MPERTAAEPLDVLRTVVAILAPYVEAGVFSKAPLGAIHLQSLEIPSADFISVLLAIEDAFGVEIDEERLVALLTLDDVVRAVEAARREAHT